MAKKPGKSAQLAALLPQELYDRLTQGATRKGVSMGAEARRLLEAAVRIEDSPTDATSALVAAIVALGTEMDRTLKGWEQDRWTFEVFKAGVGALLKHSQPVAKPGEPAKAVKPKSLGNDIWMFFGEPDDAPEHVGRALAGYILHRAKRG